MNYLQYGMKSVVVENQLLLWGGEGYSIPIASSRQPRQSSKIKKICQICGREFQTKHFLVKRGGGKFCSIKCSDISHRKQKKQKCIICGTEFYMTPARIKCGRDKFCSRQCAGVNKRKEKIKCKCILCGKKFYTQRCYIKRNGGKYCSLECTYKNRKMEGHPNWQGGKSFEPYGIEFNDKLKKHIRIRDKSVCQECGKKQSELNITLSIHHIDYNKKNNVPNNLISFCQKCHLKTNYHNRKKWKSHFQELILSKNTK